MQKGLQQLTHALFDYAGMYPPAKLSLEEALTESAQFPKTLREPTIQAASLVCEWQHLTSLTPDALAEYGFENRPFSIALLGSPVEGDFEQYLDELRTAVQYCVRQITTQSSISLTSFEVKTSTLRALINFLRGTLPQLDALVHTAPFTLYFEDNDIIRVSSGEQREVLTAISELNHLLGAKLLGLKLRTGGDSPLKRTDLIKLLPQLTEKPVPLKLTGGLHHPIVEIDRYGNDLGFLTVAAAIYLSAEYKTDFNEAIMLKCLATEDLRSFDLSNGLKWASFSLSFEQLEKHQARLPIKIGSCSLSEPDADLIRLFG